MRNLSVGLIKDGGVLNRRELMRSPFPRYSCYVIGVRGGSLCGGQERYI